MKKKGSLGYLLACSLIAALGGFLFGFDTAVISGTTSALEDYFALSSKFWLGFTVAIALWGTVLGAIVAGRPADRYGRRGVLFVIALLYFVSAVGSAFPWDWGSFLFFRFIGGIGVGAASVVAPMYIAEIAPSRMRGRLVAIVQFNIVFGITAAYLSNWLIQSFHLGVAEWRWMFGVEAVPAFLYFLLLFLTPESPRWLVLKSRIGQARTILGRFTLGGADADAEIAEIQASIQSESRQRNVAFFRKAHLKPILLAFAIATFNQLSGINAVLYYSPTIFEMAGYAKNAAFLSSVIVGIDMTVFTLIALLALDLLGRKKIMIVGSIGYIVGLTTIAAAFFYYGGPENFTPFGGMTVLTGLLIFIAAHSFGQGSVIWVFISEIFPNQIRARGLSFGCFTHGSGILSFRKPFRSSPRFPAGTSSSFTPS